VYSLSRSARRVRRLLACAAVVRMADFFISYTKSEATSVKEV
jgi:hypothetical protein